MTTTFIPRAGSVGERALKYLKRHGRKNSNDLADGIDCERGSLYSCMNLCVSNKLVTRTEGEGNKVWYELTKAADETEQLQEQDHEPVVAPSAPVVTAPAEPAVIPVFAQSKPVVTPGETLDWTATGPQPVVEDGQKKAVEIHVAQALHGTATPEVVKRVVEAATTSMRLEDSPAAQKLNELHGSKLGVGPQIKEQLEKSAKPARRHFDFGLFKSGRLVIEVGDGAEEFCREETEELYEFFIKIHLAGGIS